ncbi:FtsQ-type POTRA domain-containing protein [bacterium]|nr:FtsQ-type POTRA domain-containing protein [bacterium]
MLKAYTSNIVTSQKIYRRVSIKKKAKRAVPLFHTVIDIASVIIFVPIILILLNNYYNEYKNFNYFKVKNIEINGLKLLSEQEGRSLLNFINGINIFEIKYDFIKERLIALNFIQNVQVTRKYPDTIIIDVSEKNPFIQLKYGNRYNLYDKNLSNLLNFDQPYPGILNLEVNSEGDAIKGILQKNDSREDVLAFFTKLAVNELFRDNFILDINKTDDILLISRNMNLTVRMGIGDLSHKLERFKKFMLVNGLENLKSKVIDNRFKDMIIVRKV